MTKNTGRQYALVAYSTVTFADLVSGTAVAAVDIPAGAEILRGTYNVSTVFNSGTSDAVVVQDNAGSPVTFVTDADATALETIAFTIAAGGYRTTTPMTVDVVWTGVGTAPTTGTIKLAIEYVLDGRANEVQPAA